MLKKVLCGLLLLTLITPMGGGAGCNCDDTCAGHAICVETGNGFCRQIWYKKCWNDVCGSWAPWKYDCLEYCEWTNWDCVIGGPCEEVTYHIMQCVN